MPCSVVIRSYNEAEHIGRLLEGIGHQTAGEIELILVDSGSTDLTVDIAQGHGAHVLRIPAAEFSFGRSLNLGLQAATHEHVVIASAHVHPVYPDWIECLLRPFEDDLVAVVYGKQRGAARSKFSERQILRQWFPEADVARQPGPFCNNANAAIRRSLWKRSGYDETLTGLEDVAWAKWAQEQGYHVAYAAHAEIIHMHDETPRRVYERYRREAMAFKRIFPESHFSGYDFVRLTATNISSDLQLATGERKPWRLVPSIFWFRLMQFWGTYQGYRHSSPVTQQLRQTFYYPKGRGGLAPTAREVEPIRYDEDN
jgi:glycosyltransferase involved in cell wall biosynthesis